MHGILTYLATNSIALFLYRCMCVTDISTGGGGVILPVVTEYSFVYFCQKLALIRSCFCLDLVAMGLIHF